MWKYASRVASPLCATILAVTFGATHPAGRARRACDNSSADSLESRNESEMLLQRMLRNVRNLDFNAGSSMLHCESEIASTKAEEGEERANDMMSDVESDDSSPSELNPGDFSHKEDEKSFNVSPSDGIMVLMQSSIGPPGRDGAALATQLSLAPGGVSHVWILSDQKAPGLQAVLQPGPDGGKLIKVAVNGKPSAVPGLLVDAETLLGSGGVQSVKSTAKFYGDDFHTTLAVSPMGQGPPNAEFNYHQTIAPGWTAGGSLAAAFSALMPVPVVQRVVWGTYGSWTEPRRRDRAVYWRWAAQPRQDGSDALNLAVQTWHRVNKGLELGANISLSSVGGGGPSWLPIPVPAGISDTAAGVGARMTFEGAGGLNPVLMAHLTTAGVASLQWQKPSASGLTNTFMRTTLSAVLDHPKRDYKWGLQLELYY